LHRGGVFATGRGGYFMRESDAFSEEEEAGGLISNQPPSLPVRTVPDSPPGRDLGRLLIPQGPVGRHTQGGKLRRGAVKVGRFWYRIPAMLEEETAHGHSFLFVPVLIGAGAACWFTLAKDPPFWPYLFAFIVCSVVALINRHRVGALRLIPLGVALFLAGMMLAEFETWRRGTVVIDSPVTVNVTGVVERREVDARGRWRYVVRVEKTADPEIRRQPQE